MIQRVQTIWLLLAALCCFLTLNFPFYSGSTMQSPHVELNGRYNLLLTILTVIAGTIAVISIFLFKNRKTQLKMCFAGLVAEAGCIALYFYMMRDFVEGTFALWAVLSFAILVFYIMAISGIYKDQKLIKSLDRLR